MLKFIVWLAVLSFRVPVWAADVTLASDTDLSSEGYFVISLSTEMPGADTATLEQSTAADFREAKQYILPANGNLTITGLPDGVYHFRARLPGEAFSDTLVVEVAHHSLARAFGFFLVGLLLFLILTTTIVYGNKSARDGHHAG